MAKPFDATTKDLFESDPVAWMTYLGLHPQGPVEVIDSDLSTVTAEADKVYRVSGPEPYLVHVEMQSSGDITLPRRLLRYNVLLDYRHNMRVWSVAVLLRPEAEALTGSLDLRLPDGQQVHDFRYAVVKTWRQSAEAILQGPLGTLPMALLADIPPESAPMVLQRIDERLIREATEPEAARLINSTLLLAGLRFEKQTLAQLFLGVRTMNLLDSKILKDSSAYQLLEEMMRPDMEKQIRVDMEKQIRVDMEERVRVEEARSILIGLATDRFGEPTETQKALLDGITDRDRLFRLCKKVGSLSTWDELLASESLS
jgi:predicted transposase YdaD